MPEVGLEPTEDTGFEPAEYADSSTRADKATCRIRTDDPLHTTEVL